MRILITGSRDWEDAETIMWALLIASRGHDEITVVHGDARGADRIAGKCASDLGFTVEKHPADWSKGKSAGPVRNAHMVSLGADLCLAFPIAESRGTWDCVRKARSAGITLKIYPGD